MKGLRNKMNKNEQNDDPMVVSFEIPDYHELYNKNEPDLSGNLDDIVDRYYKEDDYKPGEICKMIIAARKRGIVGENILLSDKLLHLDGAISQYYERRRKRRTRTELDNGKKVNVPTYVGHTPSEDDIIEEDEENNKVYSYTPPVGYDDERAPDLSKTYIRKNIIGQLRTRFSVIAYHEKKAGLIEISKWLKAQIDLLVDELG